MYQFRQETGYNFKLKIVDLQVHVIPYYHILTGPSFSVLEIPVSDDTMNSIGMLFQNFKKTYNTCTLTYCS
jgi:hypothetical protein